MTRIHVTKTFLPPIEEYEHYLKRIWETDQLTNHGPLLRELEAQVSTYLGVEKFHFVANATLGLQLSLRALDITEGEIITTPFSYVATTSAILWERCKPVFVDIEPHTFNIDPDKIEAAITPATKAILAVHVFGFPCAVERLEAIAKKHDLKVIYDAAHAFGAKYKGRSLLDYGDISVCSFHATKLFHTVEGGCIITRDQAVHERIELMKRFGHHGDTHYLLGINAKASEFHAAMGLCNLKYVDGIIAERRSLSRFYDRLLGDTFERPLVKTPDDHNYNYYPVLFRSEEQRNRTMGALAKHDIFPRRYFYPSLHELPYLDEATVCPISADISRRIVCLPLYAGLDEAIVTKICEVMINEHIS